MKLEGQKNKREMSKTALNEISCVGNEGRMNSAGPKLKACFHAEVQVVKKKEIKIGTCKKGGVKKSRLFSRIFEESL